MPDQSSKQTCDLPGFQKVQYAFAAHLRDPKNVPRPGDVEDRRMEIYRDLFYNNIQGFIENGFPVLRKLYEHEAWHRMVRDFYIRHQSHTPFFSEIAQEFLKYLQDEHEPQPEDPAFLLELAHYEWVELALSISDQDPDFSKIEREGDLVEGVPVLSPLAWLLSYQYPVHRIGPDFRPDAPDANPTQIVVYRTLSHKVKFMLVNPVTARLIALIVEKPGSIGRELLAQIAQELNHPNPDVVIRGGAQTLAELRTSEILLGTFKRAG